MRRNAFWLGGLLLALAIAAFLSPWASALPDGLDHTAARLGFEEHARETPLLAAPFVDYQFGPIRLAGVSTAAAGVLGTLVVFGGMSLLGRALARRRSA